MDMKADAPLPITEKDSKQQQLPCNLTFSYSQLEYGIYVSLFGFTAGPPATINSPQLMTPGYNPAAMFNGWSLGGQYGAYAMAFIGEDSGKPTLFLQGWVTDIQSGGKFQSIDYKFPLDS